jgi:hypothetical protein
MSLLPKARPLLALAPLMAASLVAAAAPSSGAPDRCGAAYTQFEAGSSPPACWRPYSDSSPFNQTIPANPRLHPRSAQIVKRLVGFGRPNPERAGIADTDSDYDKAVYFAEGRDPVVRLDGSSSSPIDGHRIRVPAGARPAAGSDGHMTIVQPSGWEYDLYRARRPSRGVLRYDSGRRIRITGSGLRSGATASRFGNLAGLVRAPELEAGRIEHALVMTVDCTSGRHVWPAARTDSRCRDPRDAPPMGARFQLALGDRQIDALRVPGWKKTFLRALARYGAYVGDSTSSAWSLLNFWSGTSYTSFGRQDPLVAFARRAGVEEHDGVYYFRIDGGVDWERHLRVIHPSVARRGGSS